MKVHYETITLGINSLDRFTLPKFQRGLVWTEEKKRDFVKTLHNGFPFGAMLVYPEDQAADSKLLLLDGQQRLSTIKQYRDDPLHFWKPLNQDIYDARLEEINSLLSAESQLSVPEFDALLTGKTDLADWSDDVKPIDPNTTKKQLRDSIKELLAIISSYVDLDDLSIFAIKFLGSKDQIAEVFANLNKGGMPLSKYEIYSAAWIDTEISLLPAGDSPIQDEILNLVKKYYTDMEREFDLNNFSEDELTATRKITLSEFGMALGSYIQKRLNSLIPGTEKSANEIGFGVLGIATGVDNRQLNKLNRFAEEIDHKLQIILERVDQICTNLQDVFGKLLKQISASKKNVYSTGLSTTFKTLSYFAALWDLAPNSEEYRLTLKNIKSYYIFDSWTKVWSSHGDQRLYDYYPNNCKRNYLEKIAREDFVAAFNQWIADITPGIQFSGDTKALVTVHANLTYMASTVPQGDSFELEHIIAKKLINDADDTSNRHILGGCLGNCMYLPKQDNNKKKYKDLYQVNDHGQYSAIITSSKYFTKDEFVVIYSALSNKDYAVVNEYILERTKTIGEQIIDLLLD